LTFTGLLGVISQKIQFFSTSFVERRTADSQYWQKDSSRDMFLILVKSILADIAKSEAKSRCDRQCQSALLSRPENTYGFVHVRRPLCGERTGLSFVRVTVSSNMSVVSMYTIFTVYMLLHGMTMLLCMQYIQGLCQSMLSTADHGPPSLADATTAV
jgi:hypothetical protein